MTRWSCLRIAAPLAALTEPMLRIAAFVAVARSINPTIILPSDSANSECFRS